MLVFERFDKIIDALEEFLKGDKPSKKDVWNQTVAFLAGAGEKKYQGIHAENQAKERAASGKAPAVPKGPSHKGTDNEVSRVKGAIVPKTVHYPESVNGKETGKMLRRTMQAQEVHHFKWRDGKWNHTHTSHEGAGVNSKK